MERAISRYEGVRTYIEDRFNASLFVDLPEGASSIDAFLAGDLFGAIHSIKRPL
jgi:hypothetical protein